MNVFTLRKKLKSFGQTEEVQPTISAEPVVAEAPIAAVPAPQPLPERIGLNDIFDMTDSDLNRISPKHTFSRLRKPQLVPSQPVELKVFPGGLNALLTMED